MNNMCLLAMREVIIWWVTLSLIPVEFVFDTIDAEIERGGGNDQA